MSAIDDAVAVVLGKIDTATNAIAARIDALVGQVANGTISPDQIQAAFQPEIDKLTALGTTPP